MTEETTVSQIQEELAALGDDERAMKSHQYFKAEPGGYSEGDRFRGIRVPVLRQVARTYAKQISLSETEHLLQSPFHEDRFVALVILVEMFKRADEPIRRAICTLYLSNTAHINNWDLVDTSAEHVIGAYLWDRDRAPLYELAQSTNLWERRMAVMATFHFIKRDDFDDTLRLAEMLLGDTEDLIHKAVGWMLREIGKRERAVEETFLQKHYRRMPRTMLRYAIEKFPEELRQQYLKGKIAPS